ncbi:MAG: sensor histidine kinase N-terminal domain-containing protein [Lysobacter sp.]|nr:sensor histidine kinase N-terminal domain-containing protein [Lysobacter sp.]
MIARPARGLQARLLWWLLPSLAVLVAVNSVSTYRTAVAAVNTAYDRSLLAVARAVADRVELRDGRVAVEVPYIALDFFASDLRGRVYYRVGGLDGGAVSGYDDLPPLPPDVPRSEDYFALARFYSSEYRGEAVRVVALHQPVLDDTARGMALIQVAETLVSREALTRDLMIDTVSRQLLLVALAALVILVVVRTAFGPLGRLRAELDARSAGDLAPIDSRDVPKEVGALVAGMNDYVGRLKGTLDRQERFIADASHQLRTPLAVLRAQASLALREEDPARLRETLAAMDRSVGDTIHLANQLLTRARAQHGIATPSFGDLDLAGVAREACLELGAGAVAKRIDLGFEGEHAVPLRGDPTLMRELVKNLVDNAIRYTPEGGRVTVRLSGPGEAPSIQVEDSGEGVAAADRERVFEPFYRLASSHQAGVGLGLSIVRDIARAHGASIDLGDGPGGTGLTVRVTFPAPPSPASAPR